MDEKCFRLGLVGIGVAGVVVVTMVFGFKAGVADGNEHRGRSIQACLEHGGVWLGESGSCVTR